MPKKRFPMSPSVRRLGQIYAAELGLDKIPAGETVTPDFYTTNHVTGQFSRRTVVKSGTFSVKNRGKERSSA